MPINFNVLAGFNNPSQPIATAPLPQSPGLGDSGNDGDGLLSLFKGLGSVLGKTPKSLMPQESAPPIAPQMGSGMTNAPSMANSPMTQMAMNNRGLMPANPTNIPDPSDLNDLYRTPAFKTALSAQQEALKNGVTKSPVMTVVDYSIPSNKPRLWVVDTKQNKILMNTYVAHGSGSGKGVNATSFSNQPDSHASSLGTYLTEQTYQGKHGESLRVKGLEKGVNDNAFARAIVVHGGNYVGKDKSGNSWGCFAVPNQDAPKLIGLTKNGTIIHAYAPDKQALMGFGRQLTPRGQVQLSQQFSPIKNANPELSHTMVGIAGVETGNAKDPYSTVGKATKSGDRAYGKYQIMGANIPAWTRAATGTPITPQQFLNDPHAQEQTAGYIINGYLNQGYSPQDVQSLWFTGRPYSKAGGNVKDAYGTTNAQYQKKFNKFYLESKSTAPVTQQSTSLARGLSYNKKLGAQPVQTGPTNGGTQPPQIQKELLEQIIRELDKGKSYNG